MKAMFRTGKGCAIRIGKGPEGLLLVIEKGKSEEMWQCATKAGISESQGVTIPGVPPVHVPSTVCQTKGALPSLG
jgi:hypothetical protein